MCEYFSFISVTGSRQRLLKQLLPPKKMYQLFRPQSVSQLSQQVLISVLRFRLYFCYGKKQQVLLHLRNYATAWKYLFMTFSIPKHLKLWNSKLNNTLFAKNSLPKFGREFYCLLKYNPYGFAFFNLL